MTGKGHETIWEDSPGVTLPPLLIVQFTPKPQASEHLTEEPLCRGDRTLSRARGGRARRLRGNAGPSLRGPKDDRFN